MGTFFGVLLLGVISNMLNMLRINPFLQEIAFGAPIVLAIGISWLRTRGVGSMSRPRHVRVVIVGAGSVVFTKTLIRDILAGPIRDVEFVLMDPSTRRTPLIQRWAEALIEAHGLPATVVVETDQAAAIAGSDYVFTTFEVGGLRATELDDYVPLRYGVDQLPRHAGAGRHLPRPAQHPGGALGRARHGSAGAGCRAAQLHEPAGHGLLGRWATRRSARWVSATGPR